MSDLLHQAGNEENRGESTSLTSTEGESEGGGEVTTIEILRLFEDNKVELATSITELDAKVEREEVEEEAAGSSSAAGKKYEVADPDEIPGEETGGENSFGDYEQGQEGDEEEDDDTLSSEAFVDDIELILMPEGTEDLPEDRDNSPKLVRVTELRSQAGDDDEEEDDCDFRKMDSSERSEREDMTTPHVGTLTGDNSVEEDVYEEEEGAVGITHSTSKSEVYISFEDDDHSYSYHSGGSGKHQRYNKKENRKQKIHSGVQTDITALERDYQPSYDFKMRKAYLGGSVKASGSGRASNPIKKLNWKSELTLLPSKTKIGYGYGASYGALTRASDDRDQYSSRVTKFTSQDNVLSSSSQFLKPSTLYRTRNLSRNLNHFGSSETTLVLPMTETTESTRYRDRIHSGTTSGNTAFKAPETSTQPYHASHQTSSYNLRTQSGMGAKNFRSSLPDLSLSGGMHFDNKRRQSQKSMRSSQFGNFSSGLRSGNKKSSSDDETSSLIDESERCLRSSIDLLLTDDYSTPGLDYPYRHFSSGSFKGGYSARRTCSQPILTDQGAYCESRDMLMGSPFLPRKLSDMRCSKWAKVILPNGQVSVVAVSETDECKDSLTVHTDSGCIINLPFRKVVFAWRTKR